VLTRNSALGLKSGRFDDLERPLGEAETFPEAISVIVTPWRRLLVDHAPRS
jgi:hypothetical protein